MKSIKVVSILCGIMCCGLPLIAMDKKLSPEAKRVIAGEMVQDQIIAKKQRSKDNLQKTATCQNLQESVKKEVIERARIERLSREKTSTSGDGKNVENK